MIIYVDIDGTLCTHEKEYRNAIPNYKVINKVNELYNNGHHIVIWTARGATTGIDWTEVTSNQLEIWGVRFHELYLNKPNYDLFICDKSIKPEEIKNVTV